MNIADVGDLTIGQWAANVRHWQKAHATKPSAPSEDEFDLAVMQARGAA
ncbi:MAG: hypothetical protein J0H11_15015 [Rhizobiales bacterium]|nr:hypothetical protein [Hyphomicrobiales bacterium]